MKCPEYPCAFIANHKEVLNYLQAVDRQRYEHLVLNIGKEHSKWLKMLCYCDNPYSLKQSKTVNNPGRMFFSCRSRTCSYFQWLDASWNHKILVFTLTESSPTTTSIPWLSITHGGLPTNEEADRNAISISPVQAEWTISREHTPSMPPSTFQMACHLTQRLSDGCFSKAT